MYTANKEVGRKRDWDLLNAYYVRVTAFYVTFYVKNDGMKFSEGRGCLAMYYSPS